MPTYHGTLCAREHVDGAQHRRYEFLMTLGTGRVADKRHNAAISLSVYKAGSHIGT